MEINQICMNEEIQKFDFGLETYVGERGITLSGGQKQRLTLGRALLKNSQILIIDDGFSNIDVENENKILSNIYSLKGKKTTLIISSRISSVSKCDKIIVLNNGKVIEKGTHQDLLKLDGEYKKIHNIQHSNF